MPHCPKCHKTLGGWSSVDSQNRPRPKDVTVCVYCSSVLEFDKKMHLSLASAEAIGACDFPDLQQTYRVVESVRKALKTKE